MARTRLSPAFMWIPLVKHFFYTLQSSDSIFCNSLAGMVFVREWAPGWLVGAQKPSPRRTPPHLQRSCVSRHLVERQEKVLKQRLMFRLGWQVRLNRVFKAFLPASIRADTQRPRHLIMNALKSRFLEPVKKAPHLWKRCFLLHQAGERAPLPTGRLNHHKLLSCMFYSNTSKCCKDYAISLIRAPSGITPCSK